MSEALLFEPAAGANYVEFLDTGLVMWRVRERDCRTDPGARGECCLIFSSEHAVRRVWFYPRDWQSLPAESLQQLCCGLASSDEIAKARPLH